MFTTQTKSYYKQELKNYLAKAEPSQTQEVAEKEVTWEVISKITGGIFPESYDFPFLISQLFPLNFLFIHFDSSNYYPTDHLLPHLLHRYP